MLKVYFSAKLYLNGQNINIFIPISQWNLQEIIAFNLRHTKSHHYAYTLWKNIKLMNEMNRIISRFEHSRHVPSFQPLRNTKERCRTRSTTSSTLHDMRLDMKIIRNVRLFSQERLSGPIRSFIILNSFLNIFFKNIFIVYVVFPEVNNWDTILQVDTYVGRSCCNGNSLNSTMLLQLRCRWRRCFERSLYCI